MLVIWLLCLGSAALQFSSVVDAGNWLGTQCPAKKPPSYLNNISNEQLVPGSQITNILDIGEQKRYTITLDHTTPLLINITGNPALPVRRIFYNQTTSLSRYIKMHTREIFLPCAANGQYDLVVLAKRRSSIRVIVSDQHPASNWPYLNHSLPIRVRFHRIHKRQLLVKWSKSKLDVHAVHYCIVINAKNSKKNLCQAVQESEKGSCWPQAYALESVWAGQSERIKKINSNGTSVVCTGPKTRQIFNGLMTNTKYFVDIFGVHTKQQNLTFLLNSTTTWFNRTRPNSLIDGNITTGKISAMTSVSVFFFKIPNNKREVSELRFLIIPCGGSQIDVRFMKSKQEIKVENNIYKPQYITLPNTQPGDRYILRVTPSSEDEYLKANKIAITTKDFFKYLPHLPTNTTILENRSLRNCRPPTIFWFPSPETRKFRYCVTVFTVNTNNHSSVDDVNYCMDFGRKVTTYSNFHSVRCFVSDQRNQIEQLTLLDLSGGGSYLVYVTINLVGGRAIPYESIRLDLSKNCITIQDDNSLLQNSSSSLY